MSILIWAGGFITAAAWSALNFFLTTHLFQVAFLQKNKRKVIIILLVKFPLLYLLGYLILISRIFPVLSLLIGMPMVFVIIGVINLCRRQTQCRSCRTS